MLQGIKPWYNLYVYAGQEPNETEVIFRDKSFM